MTVQTLSPIDTDDTCKQSDTESNTPHAEDRSRSSGGLRKRVVNNPLHIAHAAKRPAYTTTWDLPAARRLRTNTTSRPLAAVNSLRTTRRLVNAGTRLVYPSRREVRNFMSRPIHAIRGRISTFEHQEDSDNGPSGSGVIPQPDKEHPSSPETDQKVVLHVKVVRYESKMVGTMTNVVAAQRGNRRDVETQTDPVLLGLQGYVLCDTKYAQTDDTLDNDTSSCSSPDMQIGMLEPNDQSEITFGNCERSAVTVTEDGKIEASDITVISVVHNDAVDEGIQSIQECQTDPIRENSNEQFIPSDEDNQSEDSVQPDDSSRTTQTLRHDSGLPQSDSEVNIDQDAIDTTEPSTLPQDGATQAPIGTYIEYWPYHPPPLPQSYATFNLPYPYPSLTQPSYSERLQTPLESRIQQLTHTFSQSLCELVQQSLPQYLQPTLYQSAYQPSQLSAYQPSQMQQHLPQQPPQPLVYQLTQLQQQLPPREPRQQPSQEPPQQSAYQPPQQPSQLWAYQPSQMQQHLPQQPSQPLVYQLTQLQQLPSREPRQQPSQQPPQQPSHQSAYQPLQMQQQPTREPSVYQSPQHVFQWPQRLRYRPSQQPPYEPQQQPSQEPPLPTQQSPHRLSQRPSHQPSQQTLSQPQQQPSQQLRQQPQSQPPPRQPHVPLGVSMEADMRLLNTSMNGMARSMGTLRTLLRPHLAVTPGPLREINASINGIEVALRAPLDGRTASSAQRSRLIDEMFTHVDTATVLTTLMVSAVGNRQQRVSREERPSESGTELNRLIRSVNRTLRRPRCVVEDASSTQRGAMASSSQPDVRVFRPSSPEPSPLVPPDDSVLSVISRLHSKTATAQLQRMLTELPRQQRILALMRRLSTDIRVPGEYACNTPVVLHIRYGPGSRFSCLTPDPPATRPPAIPLAQPARRTSDTIVTPITNATHWSTADGSLGPSFRPMPTVSEGEPPRARANPPSTRTEQSFTCDEPLRNIAYNPAVEKWRSDMQTAVYRLQTSVNTYVGRDNSSASQTWAEAVRTVSSRMAQASGCPFNENANDGWAGMTQNELFAHLSSAMESMDVDVHRNNGDDSLLSECMEAEQAIRNAASQTNTEPRYITLESECFSLPDGAIPTVYRTPSEFGVSFDGYLETLADNVRYTTQNLTADGTTGDEPAPGASAASTYLNVNEFISVLTNLRAHIQHIIQAHENQSTNTRNIPTALNQHRRIRYSSMANQQPMRNNHPTMASQPIMSIHPVMPSQPMISNRQTMVSQSMRPNYPPMGGQLGMTNNPQMCNEPDMGTLTTIIYEPPIATNYHTVTSHSVHVHRPSTTCNLPVPLCPPTVTNQQTLSNDSPIVPLIPYDLHRPSTLSNRSVTIDHPTVTNQQTLSNGSPIVPLIPFDLQPPSTLCNRSVTIDHPTVTNQQTLSNGSPIVHLIPFDLHPPSTLDNRPVTIDHPTVTNQQTLSNGSPIVPLIPFDLHQPSTICNGPVTIDHPTVTNQQTLSNGSPIVPLIPFDLHRPSTLCNRPVTVDHSTVTNQQTLSSDSPIVGLQRLNHDSYMLYQLPRGNHSITNQPSMVTNQSMVYNPTSTNEPVATNNSNATNKSTVSHPTVELNQTVTERQSVNQNPSIAMNQPGAANQQTVDRQPRTHRQPGYTALIDRYPPPAYNYVPGYVYSQNGVPRPAYVAQPNPSYRGGLENNQIPQYPFPRDSPYPHPPAPQASGSAEQDRRLQDTVQQFQQINDLLRDFSNNL